MHGCCLVWDAIKHLFASDKHTIQMLRSHGLNITNDLPFIRNLFTAHAVGDRSGLPSLALSHHS